MIPVIYVCALSLDGKTTRHFEPNVHAWTSKEDQAYFKDLVHQHTAIIMGRRTYDVVRNRIRLDERHERYIYTHHPEQFRDQEVPGQLSFTHEEPASLVQRLEAQGHKNVLLTGGAHLANHFLTSGCLHELWVTLEPRIFGTGDPLFCSENTNFSLQLLEQKQGNAQGTLFLRYRILSN